MSDTLAIFLFYLLLAGVIALVVYMSTRGMRQGLEAATKRLDEIESQARDNKEQIGKFQVAINGVVEAQTEYRVTEESAMAVAKDALGRVEDLAGMLDEQDKKIASADVKASNALTTLAEHDVEIDGLKSEIGLNAHGYPGFGPSS